MQKLSRTLLGWCTLEGRKLLWTDTTANLYKSQEFKYVNVSPFSHIGILQSKLPQPKLEEALFWQSLHASNWDSAMVLYERLTLPEAQENARESLIVQLTRAAQTAFDNHMIALAERGAEQVRALVKPDETNHRVQDTLKALATLEQALSK